MSVGIYSLTTKTMRTEEQIKFRAWDKKENTMRSVQALFSNGHVYVYCNCAPDSESEFLYHRDKSKNSLPHHLNGHDVVMMQFTGLVDKNGVNIYEGDILDSSFPAVVEWCHRTASFVAKRDISFALRSDGVYRVIGNIYEHPHLLTSTKWE